MRKGPARAYIIDANINRFKEGARVLEDIARFIIKDDYLFAELKKLKHAVFIQDTHRLVMEDIGGIQFKENINRQSLLEIAHANAVRMQEAARVLEELDDRTFYKGVRFKAYDLHHLLNLALKKYIQCKQLHGLYAIFDPSKCTAEQFEQIIKHKSVKICQLRCKRLSKATFYQHALRLKKITDKLNCLLIINDHMDIALAVGDGVHLGQDDLPLSAARAIAPESFIIGITCRTMRQGQEAIQRGASYISAGCLSPSQTKPDAEAILSETVDSMIKECNIPFCVIGGLTEDEVQIWLNKGADMVAIGAGLNSIRGMKQMS